MNANDFRFGRKVIKIPVSKNELNENVIQKYLPAILQQHSVNVGDYKHLHDVYTGKSSILKKIRKYENDESMNNIVNENHIFSMVEFKKGYMFGDDIKYSCSEDGTCSDDLIYLNKYMKEQKKKSKNIDLSEDVYIAGSSLRITLPKDNTEYLNLNKSSPFEMFNLDYESSFIVYSSNFKKEKLFGGIISVVDDDLNIFEIVIYSHEYVYRFLGTGSMYDISLPKFSWKKRHYLNSCPISEYKLNKSRIGIVEIVESVLDAVNTITSSSVDNIVDFVNSLLVVYNVDLTEGEYKIVKEDGVLILQTNNPNKPAEAKYLVNQLQQEDVMARYEALLKVAYDIVGVPQASQNTTSGGDTGQARLLGAGWSRADIVGKQDEASLSEGDKENIEVALNICRMHPKCPIKEIYADDIEITFNRNRSDNLLVKTQSLQALNSMNFPEEDSLNITGLVADTHESAKKWKENKDKALQSVLQKEPNKSIKNNE